MTQEWFESADFEKTTNNDKKDSPSDSVLLEENPDTKEESPVVEENLQANQEEQETNLEKVEAEEQEELVAKTDQSEVPVKEAPHTSKSLESPFLPDPVPTKAAFEIFKEELADAIVAVMEPIQERYYELLKSDKLDEILDEGAKKANYVANKTLRKMEKAVGLVR